jgi:hypothetical protein
MEHFISNDEDTEQGSLAWFYVALAASVLFWSLAIYAVVDLAAKFMVSL